MAFLRAVSRTVATVTTILSFATAAAAQTDRAGTQPQPDIISLLKSRDARLEAWGAWYAGAGQLRHAAPLLQEIVRERLRASPPMNATLDIALDALIQLQVPLDPDLLAEVYAVRPAQALIAASLGKDSHEFLDDVLGSAKRQDWFAAANLLLQRDPRRVASRALAEVRLKLTIFIVDAGFGAYSGGGGGTSSCGASGSAPGMPPWATYGLTSFAAPGVTVLAMGPTPMYYRRTVAPAGLSPAGAGGVDSGGPTADDRIAYAAAAAGIEPERVPLRGIEQRSLTVPGGGNVATVVARARDDFARRYELFLRMLVERGMLSEEAGVVHRAEIDLEVSDRRAHER